MNRDVADAARRLDRIVNTVLALADDTSMGDELDELGEANRRLQDELRRLSLIPAVL